MPTRSGQAVRLATTPCKRCLPAQNTPPTRPSCTAQWCALTGKKVDLRKRSTTATKNYIVETRQGPAPTNVPSEVQCKDRWYVGSLCDQARHQSGM